MKKKITLFVFLALFATLTLSGCDFLRPWIEPTTTSTQTTTTSTTSTSTRTTSTSTTSTTSTDYDDGDSLDYSGVGLKRLDDVLSHEKLKDLGVGIPSTGNRKAIVIPVEFKTHRTMLGKTFGPFKDEDLAKIEPGFNGDSESTGFESVSSFYYKSSYGKLNIDFDITEVITLKDTFINYQKREYGTYDIINEALEALDSTIDFSQYDTNNDGKIDGVYIVYSVPYGGSPNANGIDRVSGYDEDFWWAWVDWALDDSIEVDGVKANYFMWASVDFFNDELTDDEYIDVNATTFIHETGHMLGLDDYYDYEYDYHVERGEVVSTGFIGGVGGADLMDATVGDHTPISKILLDWITPTVVTESGTYQLVSLQDSVGEGQHQVLLIPKAWNDSYFFEYYLVDFYTPTGLNEAFKGYKGLFTESGVRIYHIDATVSSKEGDQFNKDYWTLFSYNNSTSEHLFIKLMEGDDNHSLETFVRYPSGNYYPADATDDDLFYEGQSFGSGNTWYDGTSFGYTIIIDSIEDGVATITITK